MIRGAFTLVEMLVVVSLIALLSSMIIFMFEDSAEDAVSKSAIELKSVLERARSLAMKTGRMHAVSFHVENSGDNSVMKNFSHIDDADFAGRHWYCIIGPDFSSMGTVAGHSRDPRKIPIAHCGRSDLISFYCLADYIECMQDVQVGPRHYLLPGARFLALGDVDNLYSGYSHPTYPRPWFGYYDDATNTLYPWGSWNPDIDKSFNFPSTGLDYQGEDALPVYSSEYDTVINPDAVWGRITPDATAPHQGHIDVGNNDPLCKNYRGFSQGFVGPDKWYLASTPTRKVPRPLLNAYWGDFMIVFDARGTARMTYGKGRQTYTGSTVNASNYKSGRGGKTENLGRYHMGIESHEGKTGGIYITICRDIDATESIYQEHNPVTGSADFTKFNSVEDALKSISPYKRLFVWRATGFSEIRDMTHPQCAISAADMLQKNPYPNGY